MIDSTNPRQLADNIRKLWDKLKSISGDLLPSRSTATTGQILKLTGENKTPAWADEYSYTPPAYSETEVNTGQKWIDGRNVYCKVYLGTFPTLEATYSVTLESTSDYEEFIQSYARAMTQSGNYITLTNNIVCVPTTGNVYIQSISTVYSERPYMVVIYYLKRATQETHDENERIEKLYSYDEKENPEDFISVEVTEAPEEVKETKTRKKTTK